MRGSRFPVISGRFAALVLGAVCLVVYWPAFSGGFVWDDAQLIVENAALNGLDPARLGWMATSFYQSTYQPLGWLAYALIHAAWGANPFYFHATGVALHALCAALLFEVSRRLFERAELRRPDVLAFAAALLWAVHPLQVATAAWATEIPDQLATAFVLGALIAYLGKESRRRLPLALVLFGLSGLCRWKGVGLPLLLIALDVYPLGRLKPTRCDPLGWSSERVWIEKLAFMLISVLILFANSMAKVSSQFEPSLAPGVIARGLLLLPRLLLWPVGLLPFYDLVEGGGALAVVLVLLIAAGLAAARRRLPAAPAAAACFLAGILPPLVNAKHGLTLVFPHYAYLSLMGLFVAGAATLDAAARRAGARLVAGGVLALALFWGGVSFRLVPFWGDDLRLWTRAEALNPGSVLVQGNLGNALARAGRFNEAYFYFKAAESVSRGPYRWNQIVQHNNLRVLKNRMPGFKPDLPLFRLQSERIRRGTN